MADQETPIEQAAPPAENSASTPAAAEAVTEKSEEKLAEAVQQSAVEGSDVGKNEVESAEPPTAEDETAASSSSESKPTDQTGASGAAEAKASSSGHARQFLAPCGKLSVNEDELKLEYEVDPEYEAAAKIRESPVAKSRRRGILHTGRSVVCFSARDLVKWLVSSNTVENSTAALEKCKLWVDRCLLCPAGHGQLVFNPNSSALWRLVDDGPDATCIDGGYPSNGFVVSALDLALVQDRLIHVLFDKYLSCDGQRVSVDYRGIAASKEFDVFKQSAAYMKRVDLLSEAALTRPQRVVFFINLYNILCIAALIASGPPSNTLSRLAFFKKATCVLSGLTISLDEIENGALRANRRGPGSLKKPFSDSDSRLPLVLSSHEPRIHFALVCGARSCPPLRAFSLENSEEELDKAAADFLASDNVQYVPETNRVYLSKIMSWFGGDFGQNTKERLQYYTDHMPAGEKQDLFRKMLESPSLPKVSFLHYDWSLNDNGQGAGPKMPVTSGMPSAAASTGGKGDSAAVPESSTDTSTSNTAVESKAEPVESQNTAGAGEKEDAVKQPSDSHDTKQEPESTAEQSVAPVAEKSDANADQDAPAKTEPAEPEKAASDVERKGSDEQPSDSHDSKQETEPAESEKVDKEVSADESAEKGSPDADQNTTSTEAGHQEPVVSGEGKQEGSEEQPSSSDATVTADTSAAVPDDAK